jgi:NMD protein affecting ribosome stability and mRNA decay
MIYCVRCHEGNRLHMFFGCKEPKEFTLAYCELCGVKKGPFLEEDAGTVARALSTINAILSDRTNKLEKQVEALEKRVWEEMPSSTNMAPLVVNPTWKKVP